METETNQIDLLKKKLALILRMRDLTESLDLSGSHAEERYITLISRREAIMTQLKELDALLSECAPEEGADILLSQISETSGQVLDLDNKLALRIPDLMMGIKGHLKQLKNGRNINRAYNKDIFAVVNEGTYNIRK